jgi:hypothetical protein
MPDFVIGQITGTVLVPWQDPATPDAPTRLNSHAAYPPLYRRVVVPGTVVVRLAVDGVLAPLDSALGGRLFQAFLTEWSGPFPPVVAQGAGQTSVVSLQLQAVHLGHHVVTIRRASGGAMILHFDGET